MRPGARWFAVLATLLAAAFVFPALAASMGTTSFSRTPNCAKLSRKALAATAKTGPLALADKIQNDCQFTGRIAHHYQPVVSVEIIPYFAMIWNEAKGRAMGRPGFGTFSRSEFFYSAEKTDAGLYPCSMGTYGSPGKGESLRGPVCSPEPPEKLITVYANGVDKRNGQRIMVIAGISGEVGDVHLSNMIILAQDVASGKIH
jgi:hypothetical protein